MFNPVDLVVYFFAVTAALSLAMLLRSYPRYSKAKDSGDINTEYRNFRLIWSSGPILIYSSLMIILYVVLGFHEMAYQGMVEILVLLFLVVFFPLVPAFLRYGKRVLSN